MAIAVENLSESCTSRCELITSPNVFLRRKMRWILVRIVDHVGNQLSGSAKLHWANAEGSIGAECLMEYSPTQSPAFTVLCRTKVKIKIT